MVQWSFCGWEPRKINVKETLNCTDEKGEDVFTSIKDKRLLFMVWFIMVSLNDGIFLCHTGFMLIYQWSWLTHTHTRCHTDTDTNTRLSKWRGLSAPATNTVRSLTFHPVDNYVNNRKVDCVSFPHHRFSFSKWPLINSILLSVCLKITVNTDFKRGICLCRFYFSAPASLNLYRLCLSQSDQVLVWCENNRRCAQVIVITQTHNHTKKQHWFYFKTFLNIFLLKLWSNQKEAAHLKYFHMFQFQQLFMSYWLVTVELWVNIVSLTTSWGSRLMNDTVFMSGKS